MMTIPWEKGRRMAAILSLLVVWSVGAMRYPRLLRYAAWKRMFSSRSRRHGMVASWTPWRHGWASIFSARWQCRGRRGGGGLCAGGHASASRQPWRWRFHGAAPKDGDTTAIDFREMAPERAFRDMFLNARGDVDGKKSLTSHLASGTPGTVAGFALALKKYGTMPLSRVMRPAIKLARDGIVVNDALAHDLKTYGAETIPNRNSKAIF